MRPVWRVAIYVCIAASVFAGLGAVDAASSVYTPVTLGLIVAGAMVEMRARE